MALNLIPLAIRAGFASKGIKGLGTIRAVLKTGEFGGAYDPAVDTLTVYFPLGGAQEYYGVPIALATSYAFNPSGTVYNAQIRGKYPSMKVG